MTQSAHDSNNVSHAPLAQKAMQQNHFRRGTENSEFIVDVSIAAALRAKHCVNRADKRLNIHRCRVLISAQTRTPGTLCDQRAQSQH